MANPVPFDGYNLLLQKPDNMTEEECRPLPAFSDGEQIISCWELTPEEIIEVVRTGKVWLGVVGTTHPPLYVSGLPLVVRNPVSPVDEARPVEEEE